jgi:hypothetical protein
MDIFSEKKEGCGKIHTQILQEVIDYAETKTESNFKKSLSV